MRAAEFITEHIDSAGTLGTKSKGPDLSSLEKQSIKDLSTFPDLPSHYYDMYRFGVHMAGSPAKQKMNRRSGIANQMATIAYTDADAEIIKNSAKEMGIAIKPLTTKDSKELPDTNKHSPTAKPKRNRFGV